MEVTLRTIPESTRLQVQTCLDVLNSLEGMVEERGGTDAVTLDNEVKTSLEASIIRACNRLDKILDDDARWEKPIDCLARADASLKMQNELLSHQVTISELKLEALQLGREQFIAQHRADMAAGNAAPEVTTVEELPATPKKPIRRRKGKR